MEAGTSLLFPFDLPLAERDDDDATFALPGGGAVLLSWPSEIAAGLLSVSISGPKLWDGCKSNGSAVHAHGHARARCTSTDTQQGHIRGYESGKERA